MKSITASAMQNMEKEFMKATGYPSILLMEHAAQACVAEIKAFLQKDKVCLVLCGAGNNGGDGYAIARLLLQEGYACCIYQTAPPKTEDAILMCGLVQSLYRVQVEDISALSFANAACIVDAVFGTGFHGSAPAHLQSLFAKINQSNIPVLSVDIPSGLTPQGNAEGEVIQAQKTICFHKIKNALFLGQAPQYTGEVICKDIGIPQSFDTQDGVVLVNKAFALERLQVNPIAHKGDMGKVLLVAGSENMAGAGLLTAKGARAGGAGLITLASNMHCVGLLQQTEPSCMGFVIEIEAQKQALLESLPKYDAVLIGPGLVKTEEERQWVLTLVHQIKQNNIPCVLDAQALRFLAEEEIVLQNNFCITPHPAEAATLLQCSVNAVLADTMEACRKLHEKYQCHVVLKGARSLSFDGSTFYSHLCGSPVLAKGGSGDILGGLLVALLAKQKQSSIFIERIALGNYLLAMASEAVAQAKGVFASNAQDAAAHIAHCLAGIDVLQ